MSGLTLGIIIGILVFSLPVGLAMGQALARRSAAGQANRSGPAAPVSNAPSSGTVQPPGPTTASVQPSVQTSDTPGPISTESWVSGRQLLIGLIVVLGLSLVLTIFFVWPNQTRMYWNNVSGVDTATLIFISAAVLLGTFFLPDNVWKSIIRGFAIIALAGILFFSGFGESLRQGLSRAERCAATNNCVTPDIRVYAGQPSSPIPNYSGTCIRVTEVSRSGNVSKYYAEYRWNGVWSVNNTDLNDALRVIVVGSPSSFVEYKITRTNGVCK